MIIYIDNRSYEYELKTIIQSSYYEKKFSFKDISEYDENINNEDFAYLEFDGNDGVSLFGLFNLKPVNFSVKKHLYEKNLKNAYKRAIFRLLYDDNNIQKPLLWGILTGIRPTKLYSELSSNKILNIKEYFNETYYVVNDKIDILEKVYNSQEKLLKKINSVDYSIYIHIPFCPSRCNYCTFYSNDINKKRNLIDKYLDALDKELLLTLRDKWFDNRNLFTIYVGGGTPSSLDFESLKRFFSILNKYFDFGKVKEFSFEAGRVDTLDKEKLILLKDFGVTRISINPQTMNNKTLKKIGRNHTAEDVEEMYYIAKNAGNYSINMDIILGLENETKEDMINTLDKVLSLDPDSITVHTLSIKKASELFKKVDLKLNNKESEIEFVLNYLYKKTEQNYSPYYLYRQKNITGGHENVGFAKDNFECLYNVVIMEEIQNIIAFGPGAVSRFVYKDENRIERVSNTKNLEEYIINVESCVDKKRKEMNECHI